MGQQLKKGDAVPCPSCGMDVMEVGFDLHQETVATWMRFKGGPLTIGTKTLPVDEATCAKCGAILRVNAIDLLRVA